MAGNGESGAAGRVAALDAKRADRKVATEAARLEQYAKDLERVDELETEHGDGRIGVLKMPSFVAGLPTLVAVLTPSQIIFHRFRQMVRKGAGDAEKLGAAKDLLAASCVGYPDEETYGRMKQSWPSIHDNVGIEAIRLGEAEGKT